VQCPPAVAAEEFRRLCEKESNLGRSPRANFAIQLHEAKLEFKRKLEKRKSVSQDDAKNFIHT
jgi:hypothetical protein